MPTLIKMPDGQSFELDDAIAADDTILRDALRAAYPDAATADLKRTEQNGQKVVTVVKKAGTKGGLDTVVEALAAAKSFTNPAVAMHQRVTIVLQQPDSVQTILTMRAEIEQAVEAGDKAVRQVKAALGLLCRADPIASSTIPTGF